VSAARVPVHERDGVPPVRWLSWPLSLRDFGAVLARFVFLALCLILTSDAQAFFELIDPIGSVSKEKEDLVQYDVFTWDVAFRFGSIPLILPALLCLIYSALLYSPQGVGVPRLFGMHRISLIATGIMVMAVAAAIGIPLWQALQADLVTYADFELMWKELENRFQNMHWSIHLVVVPFLWASLFVLAIVVFIGDFAARRVGLLLALGLCFLCFIGSGYEWELLGLLALSVVLFAYTRSLWPIFFGIMIYQSWHVLFTFVMFSP